MADEPNAIEHRPGRTDETAASCAPSLPIEAPLVRAVRALEALKGQADLALMLLEHLPREDGQIADAINGAIRQMNAASAAAWQLAHLRSCKGQC